MKQVRLDPYHANAEGLLQYTCLSDKSEILKELLVRGFSPARLKDKGSSLIQSLLGHMALNFDYFTFSKRKDRDIDTFKSRESIKMIHMLVREGARWQPETSGFINDARRSLLKMAPDYTMEFIWIMSEYKATERENIEQLIRTPAMRALLTKHLTRQLTPDGYKALVKTFDATSGIRTRSEG